MKNLANDKRLINALERIADALEKDNARKNKETEDIENAFSKFGQCMTGGL